jgi:hypothetical protein
MSGLPREFLLRATRTVEPLDIYVDTASGDDVAGDGSQANPIQTLAEAERRIPLVVQHYTAVHLRGQTYTWPAGFRPRSLSAPIAFFADDVWDPTVYTTVATGAATGGSDSVLTVAGPLLVNTYKDRWIEITSGAALGDRRQVRNNTATDIIPDSKFTAAVVATNTFRIFDSAVDVSCDGIPAGDTALVLCSSVGRDANKGREAAPGVFTFVGLNFTAAVPTARRLGIAASTVFFGCKIEPTIIDWSTAHPSYWGCDTIAPTVQAVLALLLGAPNVTAWRGWGVRLTAATQQINPNGNQVIGYVGSSGGLLIANATGVVELIGGSFATGMTVQQALGLLLIMGVRPDTTRFAAVALALFAARAELALVDINAPGAATAIHVGDGSLLRIRGSGSGLSATGESAAGTSVQVDASSRVILFDGPVTFGRAVGTDYDVGNGFPQNKAFFAANGDHIAHTDGSVIVRN